MADINGTRFHLLTGAADWQPLIERNRQGEVLSYDRERASLGFRRLLPRFPPRRGESRLTPDDRRGAACDRFGNWYWIDTDRRRIRIQTHVDPRPGDFWSAADLDAGCPPPATPDQFAPRRPPAPGAKPTLRGLAVTADHYLVVGTLAPAGLFVFDLHRGGHPTWLAAPWPEEGDFAPFDLAPAPGGGVWVLDHGASPADARHWKLDRYFRPQAPGGEIEVGQGALDQFRPLGGEPRTHAPPQSARGTALTGLSPVAITWPVAIEVLRDDSLLILDSDPTRASSLVHWLPRAAATERVTAVALDARNLGADLEPPLIRGHDVAFVADEAQQPGAISGRLFVAEDFGNQAFELILKAGPDGLALRFPDEPDYLPMRRFSGKALALAGEVPHYDLGERWLPLAAQPRPRYETEAELAGLIFDGREADCVWHRLLLDACIPNGAAVTVKSRTAAREDLLDESLWRLEPNPYRRAEGSELPYHRPFTADELARDGTGTHEVLFQAAVGRFLELHLTLRGNGRTTPRLRALRVHFPRFSYLRQYLPAVYREDRESAALLDRYLANVEGLFTTLEGRVAEAQQLLDPRIAPAEYLEWLAGWLGAALDPGWDEPRRRLFIENAVELFRWRGTPGGLLSLLRLATEPCPDARVLAPIRGGDPLGTATLGSIRIVEDFLRRRSPGVEVVARQAVRPGVIAAGAAWTPAQGVAPLHERWRHFLRARYGDLATLNEAWGTTFTTFAEIHLPPVVPANTAAAEAWRAFMETGIGFTYAAVGPGDLPAYQDFLARRYRRIAELNSAYRLLATQTFTDFAAIPLPGEDDFPASGSRLVDWIQFVALALPIRRSAHRFTVLVPTVPDEAPAVRRRRLAQVEAIVAREKPAHTAFAVRPFWALFTVGGARLGVDTVLGEGSRFVALILDAGTIGESFITGTHPWDVPGRWVIGRDPLGRERP